MKTMAAYCIEVILDQIPSGPYAPAGYSPGEYVACEMAANARQWAKELSGWLCSTPMRGRSTRPGRTGCYDALNDKPLALVLQYAQDRP